MCLINLCKLHHISIRAVEFRMDFELSAKQDIEDQKLIQEGGASLELAISNIYSRYAKDIQSHYRRKGLDAETSEDLAHDVFIKLLENKENLSNVRMLGPWMWRVVFTNRAGYFRSKEAKIINTSVSDEGIENHLHYTDSTDAEDLSKCVEICIDKITEQDEQRGYALRLAVRYEWDNEQLSGFLGKKTKHATCEYISQSRKKIKPCLEECRQLQLA